MTHVRERARARARAPERACACAHACACAPLCACACACVCAVRVHVHAQSLPGVNLVKSRFWAFVKIRATEFEPGRYPASALLTVSNFARPGIVLEIQGVAVI